MNTPGNLGKTNPSRRLLAIEDDVDVQDIIKISLQLTRPDWDIWIAHSSNQGLCQAIELLPDALLLDINLPGENGFMTLNHLRADARTLGDSRCIINGSTVGTLGYWKIWSQWNNS